MALKTFRPTSPGLRQLVIGNKGPLASQELEENDAESIEVGPRIDRMPNLHRSLGRVRCADQCTRLRDG